MANLAFKGGTPVSAANQFKVNPWPPVSEETGDKIKQLYLSGRWSFNSEAEQAFEKAYAEFHTAKHGIFMANGTVTLEAALAALGIGPGDEVIVPGLTWIATAMAVRYVGATPVFADIEADTFALDPDSIEAAITPRTKAIIPVHIYGTIADMERISAIADKYGLALVEDCAHAQGGKWDGRGVGSIGNVGSFSFQQSKTLAAGESGICITNDDELAARMYRYKHIGYSRYDAQGQAATPPPEGLECHNYRGLAIPALILSQQLPDLQPLLDRYAQFAKIVQEETASIEGLRIQSKGRLATVQSYYAMFFVFDGPAWENIPAANIQLAMNAEGARTMRTYGPVYKHLLFNMNQTHYRLVEGGCPTCEHVCDRAVGIMHTAMYYPETAYTLAKIIRKVADNKNELM